MSSRFKISDLGLLSFYLGIEVKQRSNDISLSQSAYVCKILEHTGMGVQPMPHSHGASPEAVQEEFGDSCGCH
jgi:hypothetical protein